MSCIVLFRNINEQKNPPFFSVAKREEHKAGFFVPAKKD